MKFGVLGRNRTLTEWGRSPTHFPLCYEDKVGAEYGNRTRLTSLEDLDTTNMPTLHESGASGRIRTDTIYSLSVTRLPVTSQRHGASEEIRTLTCRTF